jgi:hypothetical protein
MTNDTTDRAFWRRTDPLRHKVAMHYATVLYDEYQREQGRLAVEAYQRRLAQEEAADQALRKRFEDEAFHTLKNDPHAKAYAERLFALAEEKRLRMEEQEKARQEKIAYERSPERLKQKFSEFVAEMTSKGVIK